MHLLSLPDVLVFSFFFLALGWDACLLCGCLQSKCEKWGHHVSSVRQTDPARDWHQPPSAQTEAAAGHPGNPVAHQPFGSTHIEKGMFTEALCALCGGGRQSPQKQWPANVSVLLPNHTGWFQLKISGKHSTTPNLEGLSDPKKMCELLV